MRWRPNSQHLTQLFLIVVILFSGSIWWSLRGLHSGIQTVIEQHEIPMQTITQEATNTDGKIATISTTRDTDETVGDWLDRHQAAIDAFEAT